MSDFSDGHNQDAIITILIIMGRREKERGGRNDLMISYKNMVIAVHLLN